MNTNSDANTGRTVDPPTPALNEVLLVMRNGAAVWGSDGELGPMLAIVVDPSTKTATEIAVRNGDVASTGRMIPVAEVVAATPERIDVGLDRKAFFELERFMVPYRSPGDGSDLLAPDAPAWSDLWLIRPGTYQFAVHENVPDGDVAIHRGVAVFDAAGHRAGWVEGWNFHPETGQLASLAFTAHALLHRHNVLVDASSVGSIDDEGVRLTLTAADLHDLQPQANVD